MISMYESNKKISGAYRSFVLCLDYVAISPFIYFKTATMVTAKPFSHCRHKTMFQNEYRYESFRQFGASLNPRRKPKNNSGRR